MKTLDNCGAFIRNAATRIITPPPPQKSNPPRGRAMTARLPVAALAVLAATIIAGLAGINAAFAQVSDLSCEYQSAQSRVHCTFTVPSDFRIADQSAHQRRLGDGPWRTRADDHNPLTLAAASTTTLTDNSIQPNTEYSYRIAAHTADFSSQIPGNVVTVCTGVCESAPTGSVTAAAISAAPGDTVRLSAVGRLPAGSSANAPTYAWTCMRPTVPAAATLARPAAVTLTGDDMATATFTAPALMDDAMPPNVAAAITVVCQVAISGPGGNAAGSPFMVTVTITERGAGAGAAAATNEAVLPNVLRQQTHGIHNSIFNRIQQRQREDGKWK